MERSPYLIAIERLAARLGARAEWQPHGLALSSTRPLRSEFLPESGARAGLLLAPDCELSAERCLALLPTPDAFLVSFRPLSHPSLRPRGRWRLLSLALPAEASPSPWRARRVEEVAEMDEFNAFGGGDAFAPSGPHDVYTEWFLLRSPEGDAWRTRGRARLTEVSPEACLLSRWDLVPDARGAGREALGALLDHLRARGRTRLHTLAPEDAAEALLAAGYRDDGTVEVYLPSEA